MTHEIALFLKFGSEKNIRDLYENGTVFINTIEQHRKTNDDFLRGDKYEGASRIVNSLPGKFKIPGITREFNYKRVYLIESYQEVIGNIYSLYCISSHGFSQPDIFELDERNQRFGTHCLMIKDIKYFLEAVETELTRIGFNFHHGFVNYYDKNKESKELNVFEKPLEYQYQKEFRFYVENEIVEPIKINIGSLERYSEIFQMKEVLDLKLSSKIN